ncbi:hypothetical protein Pmani_001376 [Petrolisthes manimaculis]|uniref:Uncharacterized protein n=1 Tax=Petrolisthes manimaculis TaxID=1843537 RepID=A0AAE1QME8_9EUCA|nr:hypothetical protein Pmani_001376 [Petrolisthes manimaculis]
MTTDTKPIYPNPARPDPLDQPDGSNFNFPWIIKGQVLPKSPDELVYKNLSLPRGLVCILNYHVNSYTTSGVRVGAKKDSFNLKTLFSGMGYRVELYEDLTKQQTTKALDDILANHFLKEVDSFIIVILSHGDNDLNFTTNDNFTMNLDYMRYRFTDGECPNLMSKPKIFLANFCRGPYQEVTKSSLHHDYIGHQEKEAPQDMITIHASLNTFKALRDEQQGTVFVQALCEVLAENAHDTEIGEIYLLLHNAMKLKGGTSPEQQNFVFKKFYFNPVVG